MSEFLIEGCKDIHIPYSGEGLPKCFHKKSIHLKESFLDKQSLVMSDRNADLVRGGPHRHFSKSTKTPTNDDAGDLLIADCLQTAVVMRHWLESVRLEKTVKVPSIW